MKIEELVQKLQECMQEHPGSEVKFKGTASTLWCDETIASKTIVTDITEVKYSDKHNAVMLIR